MSFFNFKKLALSILISIGLSPIFFTYNFAESHKSQILRFLFIRGPVSDKYQKMVDEISQKLNIENRQIKAYNFGLLLRLVAYHNAMAIPAGKMVIVNEDVLKELPDEVAKFLIAHELSHHKGHRIPKPTGLYKHIPLMLKPSVCRPCETDADTKPVIIAGLNPDDGIKLMKYLENPDTRKWPIYAKINILLFKLLEEITSIEKLKFIRTHPAFSERIKHLESLKPQWQMIHPG